MAINAKVDSVVYEGIEKIATGGKTVELSEVYSGSQSITENGTYDIGGKAQVVVNVPTESTGGNEPTGSINITTNGTHDVTDYAQAVVNVPQEGYTVDDFVGGDLFNKKDVSIGSNSIKKSAFTDSGVKSVNAPNATRIDNFAFARCNNLLEVNAPNATYLGNDVFASDYNLTTVNMPLVNSLYQGNQFLNCYKLATINMPLLTSIAGTMFSGCKALLGADFPNATSIGANTFYNCTSLSSVNIPLVGGNIGQSTFENCTSLEEISLPSATSINNANTFKGCTALKKLDCGVNLTAIEGVSAFANATALETIVLRYDGVVKIRNGQFNASTNGVTAYVHSAQLAAYQADSVWSTQAKVTLEVIEGSDYE